MIIKVHNIFISCIVECNGVTMKNKPSECCVPIVVAFTSIVKIISSSELAKSVLQKSTIEFIFNIYYENN